MQLLTTIYGGIEILYPHIYALNFIKIKKLRKEATNAL
jgi:hypothetical protein